MRCPNCQNPTNRLCRPAWEGACGVCIKCAITTAIPQVTGLNAWGRELPEIPVSVKVKYRESSSGNSWGAFEELPARITLTVGWHEPDALAVLIHEVCHHAVGLDHNHDQAFRAMEKAAYEEWLGEPLVISPLDSKAYKGAGKRQHRYAQINAFSRQLEARLVGKKLEAA